MNLVKCGKCGAQFNVAAMKPGSQFACGKCRNPVKVPAEATVALSADQMKKALEEARAGAPAAASSPAAPRAQPKLPPAMQARAQATSASAPTRAAGAAPAAAASAPAAVETAPAPRAARKSAGPAPEKKSPAMMYAAIGGVVVVGVIVAMVMSGGDKPKETPVEPPKPVAPPPVALKPRDPTIHDDFLAVAESEQRDSLVNRLVAAGTDVGQLESIHKWVTDPKVSGNKEAREAAKRAIDAALKSDPNCEWAHVARGDKQLRQPLQDCRDSCTKSFQMQDADEKDLLARLKEIDERPWADAVEYRKYEEIVERIRAREARIAADPRVAEAEKKAGWVRENPIFKGVELTRVFADPYVIFQEVKKEDARDMDRKYNEKTGAMEDVPSEKGTLNPSKVKQNEEWARKGKLFADRDGIIFVELNRRFRELFAERYKLPELSKAGDKGRILTGLVMWNRKSFDTLLAEAGMPVSGGIRAFYSPPQQKIFHYIGDESLQARDEIKCEGGYVQKLSDQVTFHEGTHQLQHEYSAIYRGTPLVDNDTKVDDRKAMWFEEGIAEFMGATEVEETKTEYLKDVNWRHNRILLERIKEARDSRDSTEKWTIKEFLKPNHNGELATIGQKLVPGDGGMSSHFYCRVWAFVHFLWYYDNGKYRPKYYDYLELVLKGTQSSEKFAKLMGRPNVNDWGPIEKEYEWYWQQLLRRKVGKSKVTGQWETPSTDAPTGKAEDDADFCEMWDENHKKDAKK